jgi:glycosyltransferase involved in cell wall biosynthesis
MTKISTFIIAKNEERHIAKAVSSALRVSEEVIVIDSGSTDKTVEIATALGAKVIYNEWNGYLAQKIFGESCCRNNWILNIDGDEELSEELIEEINGISTTKIIEKYKAYNIKIVILYRNENSPRTFAPVNKTLRLYNKNHAGFSVYMGDSTHDKVKVKEDVDQENEIYTLNGYLLHRSGASITQLVNKANFYSSEQAEALYLKGRKISGFRVLAEFPLWIFKAFFLRRYFVFGVDGLIDSIIFAFARFIRLAKLRELYKEKNKI